MIPTTENLRCYVIGSDGSGKTSLCHKLCGQNGNAGGWMFGYQQYYITTNKEKQSVSMRYIAGTDVVTLYVWDSSGSEDYDTLRQRDYNAIRANTGYIDVIIILFSVVNKDSLEMVTSKWIPEVNFHSPQSRIVLAGNKIDLREKYPKDQSLTYENGMEIAKEYNTEYAECCCVNSHEYEGIENLIEVVMQGRTKPVTIKQKSNCILS
jgi:small GTP-binding protein